MVEGSVGRLRGHLEHRSAIATWRTSSARADRYSTLAAQEWLAAGAAVATARRPGRPAGRPLPGDVRVARRLPRRLEGIPSRRALWLLCVHAFGQDLGEDESADGDTGARAVGNASERAAAPGELPRRAGELGHAAGRLRVLLLLGRLARAHRRSSTSDVPANTIEMAVGVAGRRPRSRALDAVHPVAGARARRAAPALLDGDAGRLARAGAHLQGAHRAAGDHLAVLRPARLSAAAVGRHPHVQGQVGAGRHRSGAARRADARGGAAVQQRASARCSRSPTSS